MTKYVKLISESKVEYAPVNYTTVSGVTIFNFNTDPSTMLQYNFKPLVEATRPQNDRRYEITYSEAEDEIQEIIVYLETEEEYQQRVYNRRKANFESNFLTLDTNKNYRLVPRGYANAQQSIDVVNVQVNKAGSLVEELAVKILFYETPDFSDETQCTEEWLAEHQYSAEPMTKEEWSTFYDDFTNKYAQKMYQQALLGM